MKVVALADRQEGAVARHQLAECGIGSGTIARWIRRGQLHRHHPGVYLVGHRQISGRGRLIAALLYAGPGAALAGRTAGIWWGILRASASTPIEVRTPRRRRSIRGVAVEFRRATPRVVHKGLPVTPVPDTLLDLARVLPRHALRKALAEADYLGLLDSGEIEAVLGRGRAGGARLRRALADHLPALALTRSQLEVRFIGLCERAGLPLPELNEEVGPFTVDAFWREHRLVAELDGGTAHGRPAAVVRDRDRDLVLRELGYRVLRYSWWQVVNDPGRVVADLRRALAES